MPPPHQGFRRKAFCKILVAGKDITARLEPYLISVNVIDVEKNNTDSCNIEIDDRDAKMILPQDGDPVQVYLGWEPRGPMLPRDKQMPEVARITGGTKDPTTGEEYTELAWEGGLFMVFTGFVTSVESGFTRRGGGRRLWVEARGVHMNSNVKTPRSKAMGVGVNGSLITLQQFLQEIGAAIGLTVKVAPSLQKISRDFWYQGNESFMSLGGRIAEEVGANFKIAGNTAILTNPLDGLNVDGGFFGIVEAEWGINLIGWRIKPYIARPQYANAKADFFDNWLGEWKDIIQSITPNAEPFGGSQATTQRPEPTPNQNVGQQNNQGSTTESNSERGTGWCLINGEPQAKGGRWLLIKGARPGVDGLYTIKEAEHMFSRNGGYVTRCNLRQPRFSEEPYSTWNRAINPPARPAAPQ